MRTGISSKRILIVLCFLGFLVGIGNPFYDFGLTNTIGDEFESQRVALQILSSKSLFQPSYYLPLWAWIQIPFIIIGILGLRIFGGFSSFGEISNYVVFNPGSLLWIGRILAALFSSFSIIFLYKIGELIGSKKVGMVAAIFYCLDFSRVLLAHFGRVSAAYSFFTLGFLYFLLIASKKKSLEDLNKAFIFLIMSVLIYPTGIVFIFIYLIFVWKMGFLKDIFRITFVRNTHLLMLGLLIGGYFLTPSLYSNYSSQLVVANGLKAMIFYVRALLEYQGIILLIALGGVYWIYKKQQRDLHILLGFGVAALMPYLFKDTMEYRYIQLVIPVIIIFSSVIVAKYIKNYWVIFILISGLLYQIILVGTYNLRYFKASTHVVAKNYIEQNIGVDSSILMIRDDLNLVPTVEFTEVIRAKNPGYHQAQVSLLENGLEEKYKTWKVNYLNELDNVMKDGQLDSFINEKVYEYLIIPYSSPSTKQQVLDRINIESKKLSLEKTISPSDTGYSASALKLRPAEIFKVERFGPYYDVYKILN
jgi:hypothetical protein